ncbi:hypothetical protein FA13DRAFT_1803172 [Coprinellus micaceus]|uniref:Uncharacterized protein n=1 Tax=Coprinellus micaceus TaxID=71717 RepID=A0A4Y7SAR8_COPMI|nr:hypothetical protein FA13DRAFT_1803172 [Coprinellus micaceus]
MVQRRINAFKMRAAADRIYQEEKRRVDKEMKIKAEEERAQQQVKQVTDTLRELANANPDFAARREAMLKRKAERERLDQEQVMSLKTPPPTPMSPNPAPASPYVSNNTSIYLKLKGIPFHTVFHD